MKEKLLIPFFSVVLCASAVTVQAETGSLFTVLPDSFTFTSGAGAWGTSFDLNDDGTFSGRFHDTNMGETGADYPNGTVYLCEFTGKFSEPTKINDYTYSMHLEYLETNQPSGEEFYEKNGTKVVYSGPYGFDNAEEFYVYLPNTPVEEVSPDFMSWSHLPLETINELPEYFYGIYNVNEGLGFISYFLSHVEEEEDRINAELNNAMSQMEINAFSDELYMLWDNELNAIWKVLKNTLDEQIMTNLTNEQLQWITDKENAAKEEALPYEGGSLYSAVYSDTLYRWTKERVYYLVKMFPDVNY